MTIQPEKLLPTIERFLKRTEMRESTFGKLAVNDPALILKLRKGRECRKSIRDRIESYMKEAS